jgi:hypothetical protein
MKEYRVGDIVWVAECAPYVEKRVLCPVCFGKKEVTLILGNGDSVILPCGNCQAGYDQPTGYVTIHEPVVRASQKRIDRVEIIETEEGQVREYGAELFASGCGTTYQALDNNKIFDTEVEALRKAQHDAEEISKNQNPKAKLDKSYSWNAGYHMRHAKRLREEIEYHEKQAILCKSRTKETEQAKKYLHELSDEEFKTLTVADLSKYKSPPWCKMCEAVNILGCWSLMGMAGTDTRVRNEHDCKGMCGYYREKRSR